ncbi:MAG: class I SAM-dependent methyltransferase [Halobacteriaceae archaeon]
MGYHTFDAGMADRLEDAATRYRYLSEEELLAAVGTPGTLLEVGSGTGFYTDSLAARAGRVVAADVQPAMHARYRENGVPDNVALVLADAGGLPLRTGSVDAAVTTMTHHEIGPPGAAELARVVRPGGRIVVADWSAAGPGEAGPPVAERFDAAAVSGHLRDAGLAVERGADRRETLLVVARLPAGAGSARR